MIRLEPAVFSKAVKILLAASVWRPGVDGYVTDEEGDHVIADLAPDGAATSFEVWHFSAKRLHASRTEARPLDHR